MVLEADISMTRGRTKGFGGDKSLSLYYTSLFSSNSLSNVMIEMSPVFLLCTNLLKFIREFHID